MKITSIVFFGIVGVLCRYYLGLLVSKYFAGSFPLATFMINMIGSFLIGLVYVFGVERMALSTELRTGIMIGLLGGFTTFSSYCLESLVLMEREEFFAAFLYFGFSPFFGLLSTAFGVALGRVLVTDML